MLFRSVDFEEVPYRRPTEDEIAAMQFHDDAIKAGENPFPESDDDGLGL